jgi:hypothetical protein
MTIDAITLVSDGGSRDGLMSNCSPRAVEGSSTSWRYVGLGIFDRNSLTYPFVRPAKVQRAKVDPQEVLKNQVIGQPMGFESWDCRLIQGNTR